MLEILPLLSILNHKLPVGSFSILYAMRKDDMVCIGGVHILTKLFIFSFLYWLIGNPFVAFLVLLVVLYLLDRRFIGILPNIFRPIQLSRRLYRARQELSISPFNASLKLQTARLLIEKRRYSDAMVLLDELIPVVNDSAEVWFEAGLVA